LSSPLLEVRDLFKHFPVRAGFLSRARGAVRAVERVSFSMEEGEVLGLVGESGSGKSTLGRLVLRLIAPSGGAIRFRGTDLAPLSAQALRPFRRQMQMVFQDPFASLDPRMSVGASIAEGMEIHGISTQAARKERVAALLRRVGLDPDHMRRYPRAFSGGQRQRIAIARALAVEPSLLVADEPVSALDVSIQAEIINLLRRLNRELGLSMLFISHDLAVVEMVAHRVMVLYLGRVVEIGPTAALYERPRHPYTEALLSASPGSGRRRIVISGEIPNPSNPPSGCVFRTRCPYALPRCAETIPELVEVSPGHLKACIRDDVPAGGGLPS
jgi:oligopeptide/dipeptide ABC transporter ATP-binding protein